MKLDKKFYKYYKLLVRLIVRRGNKKMIAYQKEKIDNAICFFAREHKKKSGKDLPQTYLYKYLAFLDFYSIEKTGIPALGLKYKAMERGPVPIELYNKRRNLKTDLYEFKKQDEKIYIIHPKGRLNLNFFSDFEIEKMKELISKHAWKYGSTNEISDASHKKILAWKRTWENKENAIIDYKLTFEGDIKNKPPEKLTYVEERYLTYMGLEKMSR